jgi:hypothetical protein
MRLLQNLRICKVEHSLKVQLHGPQNSR